MVALPVEEFFPQVERILEQLYYAELRKRLLEDDVVKAFQEAVLKRFRIIQEGYFNKGVGREDPTQPMAHEEAIRLEVHTQLINSLGTLTNGGELSLTLLSDEFLGIYGGPSGPKDASPMKWIYYFMFTSFNTDLLWVSEDEHPKMSPVYKAINSQFGGGKASRGGRSSGAKDVSSGGHLGRFGDGYLLAVFPHEKALVSQVLGLLGMNYASMLHPQSRKEGNPDIFKNITASLKPDFEALVTIPAFQRASASLNRYLNR